MRPVIIVIVVALTAALCTIDPALPESGGQAHAQASRLAKTTDPCCELADVPGVVWYGLDTTMTVERVAAYCAPILWLSPDEPLLDDKKGKDIRVPEAFPFEDAPDAPVVYYRLRTVYTRADNTAPAYIPDPNDRGQSIIDLSEVIAIDLDFFFYYPSEEGFGGHQHDVESVEMKVGFGDRDCENCRHGFAIMRVNAKAHGILWYDNTLNTDLYTVFPMTIMVEEGKHASCTDKNGDGFYTPGYDVNERINDAWGVRDVIRSGMLASGGFQSWMAKFRWPDTRVFPPLPEDSPLRRMHFGDPKYFRDGEYARDNAIYELRPFPPPELAEDDPKLVPFIEDKGHHDWPDVEEDVVYKKYADWLYDGSARKSLSVAFRYDGNAGISLGFPFFVIRNLEVGITGGWLLQRLIFSDKHLRDITWQAMYTTSASRWIDGYFAAGALWDQDDTGSTFTYFASETGLKFRANIGHTAFRFLTKLGTDFWGCRVGLQYLGAGAWSFDDIGYTFELGAGSF
jgi:hypothetical protein